MNVLAVVDEVGEMLRVHVEARLARTGCERCGVVARVKERPVVELVDVPCFGRSTRLVWHKRRWSCLEETCATGSWTEENRRIGAARMAMSDRAGRWVTEQVGRYARSVNEVAIELECDWHTVNDTIIAYGTALVDDDPDRFGVVRFATLDLSGPIGGSSPS
jgi:transposase